MTWLMDSDEAMDQCRTRAWQLYQADGVLSHEPVAIALGRFLFARLDEQPDTPEREALRSVVNREVQVATYLSCGRKAIAHALGTLLRLALPHAEHPDYSAMWAV